MFQFRLCKGDAARKWFEDKGAAELTEALGFETWGIRMTLSFRLTVTSTTRSVEPHLLVASNYLERKVLQRGHWIDAPRNDYGIDATMFHHNENGEFENDE